MSQIESSFHRRFLSEITPQPLFAHISSPADPPDGEGGRALSTSIPTRSTTYVAVHGLY
jgi:hypothetical protein